VGSTDLAVTIPPCDRNHEKPGFMRALPENNP
jgi:hypothetical protein